MKKGYLLFVFFSLLIISADRVFTLSAVRSLGQRIISPAAYGVDVVGDQIQQGINFFVTFPSLYRDNLHLREKVLQLDDLTRQVDMLSQENELLRQQAQVQGVRSDTRLVARVMGLVTRGNSQLLILNSGTSAGVYPGAIVVLGSRLIGRIVTADQYQSYLLPLLAVDSRVPVNVLVSGEKSVVSGSADGLVQGQFNQRAELTDVLQDLPLQSGDALITSSEGGKYPAGLLIGHVANIISADNQLFKRAVVNLGWSLNDLRQVFIILNS